MISRLLLILVYGCLLSTGASAKTIYVSKAGSNTSPYNTWAKAATSITAAVAADAAGDTILIGRGVYLNSQIVPPTGSTRADMTYYLDSAYVANGSNGFSGLAQINGADTIPKANWSVYSGNVFRATWSGSGCDNEDGAGGQAYVATQDGTLLEPQSSIANVNAAGEFYHDLASNRVYVQCFGNVNPNTVEIQVSCQSPVKFNNTAQDNIYFGGLDIRMGKRAAVMFLDGSDSAIFRYCKLSRASYCQTCNPAVIMSNQHGDVHDSTGNWDATYNRFNVFSSCSIGVAIAIEGEGTVAHRGSGFIGYDITETTFDSCFFYDLPGDGIEIKNSYASGTKRVVERLTARYCKFDNIGGEGINMYTNAYACSVYGSIFVGCEDAGILIGNSSSGNDDRGNHVIFNNTFYQCNAGLQVQTPYAINTGAFRYNLIYDLVPGPYGFSYHYDFRDNVSGLSISIDSNQIYEPGGSFAALWSGSSQSWSTWQAGGRDAHGSNSNPGLNSSTLETSSAGTMNRTYGGRTWTRYGAIQPSDGGCAVPDLVTLSSPANGATNQSLPLVLDWADLSGATNYEVQVDNNSNFSSPEVDQYSTTSGYTVSSLPSVTTYYWRVRAQNSCGWGSWNSSRNFTLACSLPGTPTLVSPADGATGLAQPVALDWNDVSGATNYQVQIDDNSDFSSTLLDQQMTTSAYSASSMAASTVYYWRVRAQNSCGWGSWSSSRSLSTACSTPATPTLVSPANAATGVPIPTSLDWADVSGATNYQVQVDNDSDYSSVALDQQSASSVYSATGLAEATTYYWRARAQNACGWGAWSASRVFTTTCTLPVSPTLASPANAAANLSQPITLDWNDVATATGYQVQVDDNSNFSSTAIDQSVTPSTYSASGLADGTTYYWRVRAQSSCGWGSYSSSRTFTTACNLPATPTFVSPANGATGLAQPIALDWSDITAATLYQVQVDDNSNFSSTAIDQQVSPSTYSASGLTGGTVYYWRVRAQNICGWGSWTTARSFTPAAVDAIPPVISGVNATNITNNSSLIVWTTDEAATSQIDYGKTTSYGSSTVLSSSLVTAHEQLLTGLDSMTTYHYRVRSRDAAGNEAIGDDFSFTTADNVADGVVPSVSSTYPGYSTIAITDGDLDPFGGEASTWAAESATQAHWVELNFGASRPIARVAVYWAWNAFQQRWMTSQQFRIQTWNGSAFTDVSTVSNSVADSCTFIDITPTTTSRIRYYQAVNQGPATYPSVVWLSELDVFAMSSSNTAPSVPTLSSPANAAQLTTLTPTLIVNNSTDPEGNTITYEFEVATSSAFTTLVAQASGITAGSGTTPWTVTPSLSSGTTYYWRARAYDGSLYSNYAAYQSFSIVINSAPTVPTLSSPAASAQLTTATPTLIINNSTDANGDPITYTFQVATSSAFTTIVAQVAGVTQGSGTTSWTVTPSLSSGSTYYWRARAHDGSAYSNYSSYRSFSVNTNTAPGAPSPQSPAQNSRIIDMTPDLTVVNATDPNGDNLTYQFYLYNATTTTLLAQSPMTSEGSGTTAWTTSMTLSPKTGYTWRSRAYDGQAWSSYSTTRNFRTNRLPSTPIPTAPIDGDTVIGSMHQYVVMNSIDLDGDSLTYDFEIFSDSLLTILVESVSGVTPGATQTSMIQTADLTPNRYYWWHARANDSTHSSDWCEAEKFLQLQITLDVTEAPSIVAPIDGSSIDQAQPALVISWSGESDSSTICLFELARNQNFADVVAAGNVKCGGNTASWTPDIVLNEGVYYWRAKRGSSEYSKIVSFTVAAPIFVSPNPFGYGGEGVVVHNLPEGSRFEVYTSSGDQVAAIENLSGDFTWNVRNSAGEKLGSGVFLWYVKLNDKTVSGKLIVQR